MKQSYFSHGKLLLTGEYLVLDGAKALAIPTKKGQTLLVDSFSGSGNIHWTAKDIDGHIWLNFSFILAEGELIPITVGNLVPPNEVMVLKKIIENAILLNPAFLDTQYDYEILTQLQFPTDWGLGSSSTLIRNIAQWAKVDTMTLFFNSFEGSGYDVAVAEASKPILYYLRDGKPQWEVVNFSPTFSHDLFFVHLGEKQNSRREIANYKAKGKPSIDQINAISSITMQVVACKELLNFEKLMNDHEQNVSLILNFETVKSRLFNDYPFAIKSLGAWGGDFILATGTKAKAYFKEKGYETILSWSDMVL